jgi:hypothetical protein
MSEVLEGSCLCGSVGYRVTGEPQRFLHCHCSRCRRASGTGHASNLIVQGEIEWTHGAALLNRYKVPEAKRFANVFCSKCGGPLPRDVKEAGVIVIPAGSLTTNPGIKPQARIFWDSRSDWSCSEAELPAFAEYPPG